MSAAAGPAAPGWKTSALRPINWLLLGVPAASTLERRRTPLRSAAGVTVDIASAINCRRSTASIASFSLPEMMRETSRMSSTICASIAELRSITSSARGCPSLGMTPVRSIRA